MLVTTLPDFYRVIHLLETERYIAFDTETTGLKIWHDDVLIGLSFYFPEADESFYLPFRHERGENLPLDLLPTLKAVFPTDHATYIGHNIKFDLHVIAREGFRIPYAVEDTMVAAHLLNENEWLTNIVGGQPVRAGAYSLKRLAAKYLGQWSVMGEEDLQAALKEYGITTKGSMSQLPAERVTKYAEADAEITWGLRKFYLPKLEAWDQLQLYKDRNDYLLRFLYPVEANGMYVDQEDINNERLLVEVEADNVLLELQEEAKRFGNNDFNPNSPKQVAEFLKWQGYDLPSTGADYLEPFDREGDKWPGLILRYRRLTKRNASFYGPYSKLKDANGYIHTTFLATGTVTGRLASMDPNMQQVPKDKKAAVKYVFKPSPGYTYVFADYKQLELRLAIHYAQEQKMKEMFANGLDLHQYTADELTRMLGYHISRDIGKRSNFGLLYGMGADKAALKFGVSLEVAEGVVSGWRRLYPEFGIALKTYEKLARLGRDPQGNPGGKFHYIRLFNNRVRHYNELMRHLPGIEYTAWNSLIQGSGAAITEASALRVSDYYDTAPDLVRPVLTVHDSLGWEVRNDYVDRFVPHAIAMMEDWPGFAVPIKVDVQIGKQNWRDMEDWDVSTR